MINILLKPSHQFSQWGLISFDSIEQMCSYAARNFEVSAENLDEVVDAIDGDAQISHLLSNQKAIEVMRALYVDNLAVQHLLDAAELNLYKQVPVKEIDWTPPEEAEPFREIISAAEHRYGLPDNLLLAALSVSSNGFKSAVISGDYVGPNGELGIAQVTPESARSPGFGVTPMEDPLDRADAIIWAAEYILAMYERTGLWSAALAAYRVGLANILDRKIWPSRALVFVNSVAKKIDLEVPVQLPATQ